MQINMSKVLADMKEYIQNGPKDNKNWPEGKGNMKCFLFVQNNINSTCAIFNQKNMKKLARK